MVATSIREALPTMLALAREHTELSRIQLAGMLADIFLHEDIALTLREEEQLNEIITQLMSNASPQVRAQLLKNFINITRMPRKMAVSLVQDDIEIARPILVSSEALTDEDLVRVIEEKGGDHALSVAQRAEISEAVADALVTTGDMRVMQTVVENLGADLSPLALKIASDAARYSEKLRKPLMYRPEMNTDLALKLYWWVEQDLRRYALSRFGISSGQIDQALAKTVAAFLDEHANEKSNDKVMAQVADWIEAHGALTVAVLPQVLRMGHFRVYNMLIARLAKLPLSLVDTIMGEVGGRGLSAICRAIGIEKSNFVSLFLLSRGGRPGEQIVHPRELSYAIAAFDRLTPAVAKDLLHSWTVDPSYFTAHQAEDALEAGATHEMRV